MKNRKGIIIIAMVVIIILICLFLQSNTELKGLEKQVDNIALPEDVEKVALKSKIGDSGGNGNYSTCRVVLVVKTENSLNDLKQKFESMNLKFPNYFRNNDNTPVFYITHCENSLFKSSRNFSINFDELEHIENYNNYFFVEFVE